MEEDKNNEWKSERKKLLKPFDCTEMLRNIC